MPTPHLTTRAAVHATLPGLAHAKPSRRSHAALGPPKTEWPTIAVPDRSLGHGDLVPFAYALALRAHDGQTDQAGAAYITHPARMVARLSPYRDDDRYLAVAWLHDVVEDSATTLDDLRAVGFPTEVVAAVNALARRPSDRKQPERYYRRVSKNQIALTVKLADIEDNSDPDRLALLPAETADRLAAKYAHALDVLAVAAPGAMLPGRPGRKSGRSIA